MIDLRNKNNEKRKICPLIPPMVHTETVGADGKTAASTGIIPIMCFREDCEFFCEIQGMCIHKCEHIAMVHNLETIEDDNEEGVY